MKFLKTIIEKELKTKDLEQLDLNLCRSYARSITDFIENEKYSTRTSPKLLLEEVYRV